MCVTTEACLLSSEVLWLEMKTSIMNSMLLMRYLYFHSSHISFHRPFRRLFQQWLFGLIAVCNLGNAHQISLSGRMNHKFTIHTTIALKYGLHSLIPFLLATFLLFFLWSICREDTKLWSKGVSEWKSLIVHYHHSARCIWFAVH